MILLRRREEAALLQAYQKRADEAGTHVKAPGPVAICKEIYREEGILVSPVHSAIAPLSCTRDQSSDPFASGSFTDKYCDSTMTLTLANVVHALIASVLRQRARRRPSSPCEAQQC